MAWCAHGKRKPYDFGFVLGLQVLFGTMGSAHADSTVNGIDRSLMNSITDRVRNCAILPYTVSADQRKVYHEIASHCPEVKVVSKGKAQIRVAGHRYLVALIETVNTDGDLFDVEIRDFDTQAVNKLENVMAFGDVLLGVLGGNTQGLFESPIGEEVVSEMDRNLLQPAY